MMEGLAAADAQPKTITIDATYLKAHREALAIDVDQGIKGEQVVEAMARISSIRGAPRTIRVDNGPEFISKALDRWAEQPKAPAMRSIVGMAAEGYENGVTLDFRRPGETTDNAFVESFNGRLRDECLNAHWFCPSPTLDPRSRLGAKTITRAVLTHCLAE